MFSTKVKYCPECEDANYLMTLVDKKLARKIKAKWWNKIFLTENPFSKRDYKDLLYYKRILSHLVFNKNYITQEEYKKLSSRIKIITK